MTKTIVLNNEELSVILYALMSAKENVDPELLQEMNKILSKIEATKFDKEKTKKKLTKPNK